MDAYFGIVVLRLPPHPTLGDLIKLCHTLVAALKGREVRGRLWIVQKGRIREYEPENLT
jgi:hypothetical protein